MLASQARRWTVAAGTAPGELEVAAGRASQSHDGLDRGGELQVGTGAPPLSAEPMIQGVVCELDERIGEPAVAGAIVPDP